MAAARGGSPYQPDPATAYVPYAQGWGNGMHREPNAPYEYGNGWMFTQADTRPYSNRAYLDAYLVPVGSGDASTHATGNAGGLYRVIAYFGAWKDCNGDGYMGSALSRTLEYPSATLTDTSTCFPVGATGFPYHNDGSVVHELTWFTDAYDPSIGDGWNELETNARVWTQLRGDEEPHYAGDTVPVADGGPASTLVSGSTIPLAYHRAVASEEVLGLGASAMLDASRGPGATLCAEDGLCRGWWSEPFILANPQASVGPGGFDTPVWGAQLGAAQHFKMFTYGDPGVHAVGAGVQLPSWWYVPTWPSLLDVDQFAIVGDEAPREIVIGGDPVRVGQQDEPTVEDGDAAASFAQDLTDAQQSPYEWLATADNADGTTLVYYDRNHDGRPETSERIANLPASAHTTMAQEPDGAIRVFDDRDGDGEQGTDERTILRVPGQWIAVCGSTSCVIWEDRDMDQQRDPGEDLVWIPLLGTL